MRARRHGLIARVHGLRNVGRTAVSPPPLAAPRSPTFLSFFEIRDRNIKKGRHVRRSRDDCVQTRAYRRPYPFFVPTPRARQLDGRTLSPRAANC